jgi:protocatechuate 3,4-dioxygenase beta subunit
MMSRLPLLALAVLAVCDAQTPTAQNPVKTASVEGRVTNLAGESLRKATLRLATVVIVSAETGQSIKQPLLYTAETDAQGGFLFPEIEPGTYTLSVERAGYVRSGYQQAVTLASGDVKTGLLVKLTAETVISGKITDEDGDPFPKVRVSVLQAIYSNGRRSLRTTGEATAGPDGVFAIGNLAPGRYYVMADAQPDRINIAIQPGVDKIKETYLTTFYPGVAEVTAASTVQATAGGNIRGVDIALRKAAVFRIRGEVLDASNGLALSRVSLSISRLDSPPITLSHNIVPISRDGVFEFDNLVPGTYVIKAATGNSGPSLTGREIVTLGRENIDDVELRAVPPLEFFARILTEGEPQQPQASEPAKLLRIQLIPMEPELFSGPTQTQTNENGTIHMRGVSPAIYRIDLMNLRPGTYMKSVRFANIDVSGKLLDLTSILGGSLDILLSTHAAAAAGAVYLAEGKPAEGAVVAIWTPGAIMDGGVDLAKYTATDANGRFRFENLAPGEYRVVAWDSAYLTIARDPAFRTQFNSKASAIKLADGGHENLDLILVSSDASEAAAANLR